MKTLSEYIKESIEGGYFYAWKKRVVICRQDLVDGIGATEEEVNAVSDEKMQELADTIGEELKKYSPFEKDGKKFTAARAFEMYAKGAFGDPSKAWLEEEVDTAWWGEVEKAAVKIGIVKQ